MTVQRSTLEKALMDGVSLDDFLPYLINRISNRLNADLSEEVRRELGATVQQWRVLSLLHIRDGRSIGELAAYAIAEQSTLSRLIDRMEGDGLVERRPGERDARSVLVFVRPAGRALFQNILPIALRHYRKAVKGISSDDLETTIRTLHQVLTNVRRSPYR